MQFSPVPCYLVPLSPNIFLSSYSQTHSTYVPPSMWETKFHTHTKQTQNTVVCVWIFTFGLHLTQVFVLFRSE